MCSSAIVNMKKSLYSRYQRDQPHGWFMAKQLFVHYTYILQRTCWHEAAHFTLRIRIGGRSYYFLLWTRKISEYIGEIHTSSNGAWIDTLWAIWRTRSLPTVNNVFVDIRSRVTKSRLCLNIKATFGHSLGLPVFLTNIINLVFPYCDFIFVGASPLGGYRIRASNWKWLTDREPLSE